MSYETDVQVKKEIDEVLRLNAADRTNLGVNSTKTERNEVKRIERARLKSVRHLDIAKIDRLLADTKD